MRKNFKLLLIALLALLIVASIGAITFLTPHYKTIELNGYKMEVPDSSINVTTSMITIKHMMIKIITLPLNHMP